MGFADATGADLDEDTVAYVRYGEAGLYADAAYTTQFVFPTVTLATVTPNSNYEFTG